MQLQSVWQPAQCTSIAQHVSLPPLLPSPACRFKRADFDHSGTLSKREFAVMYAGVLCEKAAVRNSSCCLA
jgi:hypothetical protein